MNAQVIVENVERFCNELMRLKQFYTVIDELTSRPLSKEEVKKFVNHGIKGTFASEVAVVKMLSYLTIKPSEFNAQRLHTLLCSGNDVYSRRHCRVLSNTVIKISNDILQFIKDKINNIGDNQSKIAELKRCILILPLIFRSERDVTIPQENLCELNVCEDRLCEDTDLLIAEVKEKLNDTFHNFYLGGVAEGYCSGLNDKNWCSVKSLIAQVLSISDV